MFKAIFFLFMLALAILFIIYAGVKFLIGLFSWMFGSANSNHTNSDKS